MSYNLSSYYTSSLLVDIKQTLTKTEKFHWNETAV